MQEPRISDKTPMSEEVGTCAIFTSVRYKRHTRGLRPRLTLAIANCVAACMFYAGHDSRVQIRIFNRELKCADTTGTVLVPWEGSTKLITDKKYKSDRTRARGMYKNIKSYLTNTFKPT